MSRARTNARAHDTNHIVRTPVGDVVWDPNGRVAGRSDHKFTAYHVLKAEVYNKAVIKEGRFRLRGYGARVDGPKFNQRCREMEDLISRDGNGYNRSMGSEQHEWRRKHAELLQKIREELAEEPDFFLTTRNQDDVLIQRFSRPVSVTL